MTASASVRQRREGNVFLVTIDRPAVRNAVDRDTASALLKAFQAFEADDEAQVAVLSGSGGQFCAGADLKALADGRGNRVEDTGPGPMGPTRMRLAKPVIAAVEGHAVAGGLELALWCDLRVASREAVFGVYCRRFGVPLIDGGTVRLPRLIGQSRALDMILTGRAVSGEEALTFGLANRLTEPGQALGEAILLAREIAAAPRTCLLNDRASVYRQWGLDEAAAMRQEFELGLATLRSGESLAGAQRFASGAGRHGESTDT
ncbi:MAG: crotonase/enoyl-CoA hydratase family protein [Gammaproteobacteria bacterium]